MSLKIATWNIACLPTLINPLRTPTFAIPKIINMLHNVNADILCLQEVFCIKSRHKLVDYLVSSGYNVHYTRQDNIISKNGLFSASKYPLKSKLEMDFINFTGPEYLIKKGVITSNIDIGENQVILHNTHLQSNSMGPIIDNCSKIRRKQNHDIYNHLIEDCFFTTKEEPLHFFCGDINDDFGSKDLTNFTKNLPFKNTTLNKKKMVTFNKHDKQLDYIICNKNIDIDYSVIDIDRQLSDHSILIAELELDM